MAKCADVMTQNPACCVPEDAVHLAAEIMRVEDVGSVPVVESHDSRKLVGIVTDRDLALQVVAEKRDPGAVKVREVMTRSPVSCRESDSIDKALEAMADRQIRRIPVVDGQNQIVGIIAQADVATRLEEPKATGRVVEEISEPAGERR